MLSNIAIEIYAMESGLLRAQRALNVVGEEKSSLKIAMARVYINDMMKKIEDYARQILVAMETGDTLTTYLSVLKKLARLTPINTVAARRQIANTAIEAEKYAC